MVSLSAASVSLNRSSSSPSSAADCSEMACNGGTPKLSVPAVNNIFNFDTMLCTDSSAVASLLESPTASIVVFNRSPRRIKSSMKENSADFVLSLVLDSPNSPLQLVMMGFTLQIGNMLSPSFRSIKLFNFS